MVYDTSGVKENHLTREVNMDALEMTLLFDYYGDLLTERQKLCFDMRYNQDLSLSEIALELNVSRQGVYDNLNRAEALLKNMEEKTGCVSRDLACRKAATRVCELASGLQSHTDNNVKQVAEEILSQMEALKE
jgi:predicted DNA-binding protein YlxM (UPF0122 family)